MQALFLCVLAKTGFPQKPKNSILGHNFAPQNPQNPKCFKVRLQSLKSVKKFFLYTKAKTQITEFSKIRSNFCQFVQNLDFMTHLGRAVSRGVKIGPASLAQDVSSSAREKTLNYDLNLQAFSFDFDNFV